MSIIKSTSTQERTDIWGSQLIRSSCTQTQVDQAYNPLYSKNASHFNNATNLKRHPNSLKRVISINSRSISVKSKESTKSITDKFSTSSFSSNIMNHPDITIPSEMRSSVGEIEGLLFNNGNSSSRKPYLAFNQSNTEKGLDIVESEPNQNIIASYGISPEKKLCELSNRESKIYDRVEIRNSRIPTSRNNFMTGSLMHSDYYIEECKQDNSYNKSRDQAHKNLIPNMDISSESRKNLQREVSEVEPNGVEDKSLQQYTQQPFLVDNEQTFRVETRENNILLTENNEPEHQRAVPVNNLENIDNRNDSRPDLERFYGPEALIYVSKAIGFCLGIIFCSGSVLLIILNPIIYVPFFMVLMVYIVFLFIVDVYWKAKVLGELYIKTEDVYQIGDSGAGFISLFIIFFKIVKVFSVCSFAFAPSALLIVVYLAFSKAPRAKKAGKILARFVILIQILLISLALDEFLTSDWLLILIPSLIILGSTLISHIITIYSVLRRLFKNQSLGKSTKIIGFIWYLTYLSTVLLGFTAIIGFAKAYSPENDFDFLEMTSYATVIVGAFLLLYTLIAWKCITKFIVSMKLIRSYLAEYEATKPRPKMRTVSLDVEKKESFFVMLSPTYFKNLQNIFQSGSQKSLQKSKSTLCCIHLEKANPKEEQSPKYSNEVPRSAKTEMLRQFNSSSILIDNKMDLVKKCQINRSLDTIQPDSTKTLKTRSFLNDYLQNFAYSMDDINELELHSELQFSKCQREENICRLCCTNMANTILLHCGHSGICYECAIILVNKQAECLECRGKIEAMYKIDPNPKFMNIIKGIELTKITEEFQ